MTTGNLRVLLADDHPVYRLGLRAFLDSVEGLEVVGEADTGVKAVAATAELRPAVVVMDLQMPELNGIEATRRIVKDHPDVGVLVLTYSDEDNAVLEAMLAGARGYVLKEAGTESILRAIRDVADGEMIFGASIAHRMRQLFGTQRSPVRAFPELTDREHQVLELMAEGLNNAAIASKLGVGEKRVRNCATEIYAKLGVAGRSQAIIRAREAGLGQATLGDG
ncbi:MAG: response regulator transcription factor [Actinomycetota bacterium]|jgi:DNA-binding NarL/FixJ family response regulator|nr:response regulator transcription factor [Actinomycetota bacterium]